MAKKTIDDLVEGEDYFDDMFSLLGTEDPDFGLKQVKEILKGILEGGYIKTFSDMDLWVLFTEYGPKKTNLQCSFKFYFE